MVYYILPTMLPSNRLTIKVHRLYDNCRNMKTVLNKSSVTVISIKSKIVSEKSCIWTTVKNWFNFKNRSYDKIPDNNTIEPLSFKSVNILVPDNDYNLHCRIAAEYPGASYIISGNLLWVDSVYFNDMFTLEPEFDIVVIPADIQLYWR